MIRERIIFITQCDYITVEVRHMRHVYKCNFVLYTRFDVVLTTPHLGIINTVQQAYVLEVALMIFDL